ncbi:MAG: hypothetical protein AAGA48_13140 [Myxococcota bacterium]
MNALAMLLWVPPASADPAMREAQSCVESKLDELYAQGWRSRGGLTRVRIEVDQSHTSEHVLLGGFDVTFRACAARGAIDLDLVLYDDDGTIVAKDEGMSRDPILSVKVPRTGRYRLVTYLRKAQPRAGAVPAAVALTFQLP